MTSLLMRSQRMKKKFTVCKKEDHDTKFESEDVSCKNLLSSSKEVDLRYDSEDDIGLDLLFHKDE